MDVSQALNNSTAIDAKERLRPCVTTSTTLDNKLLRPFLLHGVSNSTGKMTCCVSLPIF